MKNVSPYIVEKSLNNNNIILVNVLSDNIPIKLNIKKSTNPNNMTKSDFEKFLKKNDNKIPKEIDLIILYCASWSCGAAKNYYDSLKKRKISMIKIYDYKGAIHEWALYSYMFPDKYEILNLNNNKKMNKTELKKLAKNMMHTYLLKDEKEDKRLSNLLD